MAKELPYFKFDCSEWISGNITLEDLTTQGAFINICAYYWFKSGCISLTEIKRRLKLKQATIDSLIEGNHIKVTDDLIEISFLREQFDERGHISKKNAINGSKGGAPKGNKNAQKNNPKQPKTTNIEREEEQEREEEKNKNTLFFGTSGNFFTIQKKYVHDKFIKVFSDGIGQFMEHNNSVLRSPEKAAAFFEKKNGAQFADFMHFFNTYNKFIDDEPTRKNTNSAEIIGEKRYTGL